MNSTFPNRRSFSYLKFTKYVTNIIAEPKYKYGQQEQVTSLYIIVDDPTESAISLNSHLQKIQKWASEWLVTFNPANSEALLLSRKINKPYHPPLFFNNEQIQEVQ